MEADSPHAEEMIFQSHQPHGPGQSLREDKPGIFCGNRRRSLLRPIPRQQRKTRTTFSSQRNWFTQLARRLKEDSQFLRSVVQGAFAFLCIWIGIEFFLFTRWGFSGGETAFFPRPPGVEGFLPISALISLKYWVQTGIINSIHPSGLFILLATGAVSILFKKAFCSWLCPIGTLSESLWMLGQRLFGRCASLPKWLDYPLRSLKYLLLAFFLYSIWQMDVPALAAFIQSPYNKVADIKMYLFFANISSVALWTILVLMLLSIPIKNFWCRFLCPYGAFLGAMSWLSPLKIRRAKSTCIDCALCAKACPANIDVHRVGWTRPEGPAGTVWSDECTGCLACVQVCPVKNTLEVRPPAQARPVPAWMLGVLVVGTFVTVTGAAMLTGHWANTISPDEYRSRIQNIESPMYQHFQGNDPSNGSGE